KEGAIDMAWEYLVDVLGLDPKDLYVTVFEGSPEEGIARDDEAARFWAKHVPADHIINGNKHDNFWEMGDTGPCGPCSEIHLDSRTPEEKAKVPGRELVNKDDPQVIEIWNIVFMQFERKADGSLVPLSMNVIDTGMGFERLVRALQGKHSNYDTDVFQPTIKKIEELTGLKYGDTEDVDVAMRVISDHIRAVAFSIADGQLPGNAKAGYVIRRILRRAVRYAYTFLGQKQAFIYRLLPVLTQEMGPSYPELVAQQELITKVIKEEEESFLRTLETGIRLLDKVMADTKAAGKTEIGGVEAFTLFDTYGFPLDLTQLICRENGLGVDEEGFATEMQKQKDRARNAAKIETDDWVTVLDGSAVEGGTDFVGWDFTEHECHILRYRKVVQKKQTFYQIVLDKTPFYAEMGGQVGDQGVLVSENETIEIIDTKSENGLTVHIAKELPKVLDADFMACVDTDKRRASEANHSATHLLDQALREVLGTHVEQKGSLVSPEGLRFDFSHFQKVTSEELRQVERIVNGRIRENIPLQDHRDVPIDKAKELGAIALFGEKYGDHVRVVQFGKSVEFCGGCHVKATGQIGMFKIIAESSVAAGIRRIEAVTGAKVEEMLYNLEDTILAIRSLFNGQPDVRANIEKMILENSDMKQQVESFIHEKGQQAKQALIDKAIVRDGVAVIKSILPLPAEAVKDIAFQLRAEVPNALVAIGSMNQDKPLLTCAASDSLVKEHGVNVGKVIREAAKLIQGGGGGQPHFATAGGRNADGLSAALDKFIELALS
ncbi:MAG: alanine--tRNA ligase, partial [Bacteroidaceae bacterium]|nr:alanine--tRNA ligase [Bacteroidaceae bacterium]